MLRDYLNFPTRQEFIDFDDVLAHGQAVAVLGIEELADIPQETWYFDENSMAVADNVTVIKPTVIDVTMPGRYHINMVQADWNNLFNRPDLAEVATTGSYNDLEDKLTAGTGIVMSNNQVSVDDTEFMSITLANQEIAAMQSSIDTKVPSVRTVTINGTTQDLSANRSWEVGNVSTSGSYANPSWITTLAASKVTGLSTVATSGAYSDLSGKPTLFSGSYIDLTNKPTIPTNTNQLTNGSGFLTGINSGQVSTALGFTPVSASGARSAISLTTTGTSGAATYDNSTGVLNIPNYAVGTPSFNNAATKTVNGAGVQISTTKNTRVSYSVTHTIALTLLLASGSSMVYLEISPNNSTWTTVSQAGYSDGVAVAVALTKSSVTNIQGEVPAGWYVRLRAVTSGAGSASFTCGQEVQY